MCRSSEVFHKYGDGVHILDDLFLTTHLCRLCSPETIQPEFNSIVGVLYASLIRTVINNEFPRRTVESPTRMIQYTERGVWTGEIVEYNTPTVVVDIARAGMLPSQICYDTLNHVLTPKVVRQDHLIMARVEDKNSHRVTGASLHGSKIGGSIDNAFVLFPDPMGATGSSLDTAIRHYGNNGHGRPRRLITLNLIVTPEFLRRMRDLSSELGVDMVNYAIRVDRGMSPPEVLACVPGERWEEESGLRNHQYIVPGGGGFGELMNNSWV